MLRKQTFNKLVKDPASISGKERKALAAAAEKYPYCQWLQAVPNYPKSTVMPVEAVPPDVSEAVNISVPETRTSQRSEVTEILNKLGKKKEAPTDKEIKNVLKAFLNEYKSESENDITAFNLAAADKILNQLSETDKKKKKKQKITETADLSLKSVREDKKLISENLAKILAAQGKKEKALEMYGKLILKFPEKKAYFADRIKELELSQQHV